MTLFPKYHRIKSYFESKQQFSNKRNTLMKISTCTNKHILRKIEVFIRFDSFLMYIDIHTKSQNFLKLSMFSNKIFTLTTIVWKSQNFSKKKFNFFPKKLTNFAQKIDVEKNTRYFTPKFCTSWFYHCT